MGLVRRVGGSLVLQKTPQHWAGGLKFIIIICDHKYHIRAIYGISRTDDLVHNEATKGSLTTKMKITSTIFWFHLVCWKCGTKSTKQTRYWEGRLNALWWSGDGQKQFVEERLLHLWKNSVILPVRTNQWHFHHCLISIRAQKLGCKSR